ncbi:hypothetical protein Mal35_27190 [Gimesia maris]|uniref:polymorphic toxin-type HINT domain-containing protein n=1 Tax=Gimesia maris TaxID=122 RepID=UPI0011883AA9|nr:polymorphic toxin-type HINT domain-containing protein [Gimesia maris]QDT79264.1 hypothetical protein Mal35_27190 [Gimesia maris]
MAAIKHRLVVFGCLLLTGFCFWKAAPGLLGNQNSSSVQSAQAAANSLNTMKHGITTPIQDIRPGMRIVGHNPKREEVESTIDPTPGSWRLLSVRMEKSDGGYFEAQLLRPLSWISRHKAKPGRTIQLNMPEMRVVGAAEVISISDCPPIDPGNDSVVISTFKNVSNNVLNIYVEGESEPIGVTAGHPIWSEDRLAFIHSEKLQVGERLRSALGRPIRITSIEPRAGPEAVYNFEVAGEHVYCVSESGVLVHNSSSCGDPLRTLNLGAGDNPLSGAVNVDLRLNKGIDVVADAKKLPFVNEAFEQVVSLNPHGFNPISSETSRVLQSGRNLNVVAQPNNPFFKQLGLSNRLRNKLLKPGGIDVARQQILGNQELLSKLQNQGFEFVDIRLADSRFKFGTAKTTDGSSSLDPNAFVQIVLRKQ